MFRSRLLALFAQMKALLSGEPRRKKTLTQLANLPVEALGAVRQIRIGGCSEEERTKFVSVIRRLQRLVH